MLIFQAFLAADDAVRTILADPGRAPRVTGAGLYLTVLGPEGNAMLTTEADIQTEHGARYLVRLCGHVGKMGTTGHRLGHRPSSHARGGVPPEVRSVECSGTEGTVSLNWGQWTMRASPGLLAVRVEAADEESVRRIQDLLTSRLQKFGRREHLTVNWRRP